MATQNNWSELLNVDTNTLVAFPYGQSNQLGQVAFKVDNSTWATTIGTDSDFLVTTNGSFVFLDETSAGNVDDQVWTTTLDFNLSIPAGGIEMSNAEFFYVGLTASTSGSLNEFDVNDACFIMRTRAEYGRLDINFQDGHASALRILQISPDNIGWAPEAAAEGGDATTADHTSPGGKALSISAELF